MHGDADEGSGEYTREGMDRLVIAIAAMVVEFAAEVPGFEASFVNALNLAIESRERDGRIDLVALEHGRAAVRDDLT